MARQDLTSTEDVLEETVVAATFKVLVLGNSNVGKSSLIKYYSTAEKPEQNMMPTIGMFDTLCVAISCIVTTVVTKSTTFS